MTFLDGHPWIAFYLAGCVVAFFYGLILLVRRAFSGVTTVGHNLRQVGLRLSWTTGGAKEIAEDDPRDFNGYVRKFGLSVLVCAINSVTSWLVVFLLPISIITGVIKWLGAPKDVRDARWKLRNLPMDFDGVLRTMKSIEGKTYYSADRAELLQSLRDRNLITEFQFNRLAAGVEAAAGGN